MKKIKLVLAIFSFLFFGACESDWDSHYTDSGLTGTQTKLNIMDWLENEPGYSKFCQLMKETKVGEELAKDQVLTCWAVRDENMPDLTGKTDVEKKQLANHHINFIALYTSKLSDGKLIKTFAGKNIYVTAGAESYLLDGHAISNSVMCANGVIHELANMLEPRLNIYEYVERLGDDYSIYRDSLLSYNDTVFRPDLSFPLDVDETGNTIYDSVFRISNRYFRNGDFREENVNLTLFVPSNKVVQATFKEITDLYKNVYNSQLGARDSIFIFQWIMAALPYEGKIENYHESQKLESVYGAEWRTDIQKVDETPVPMSNGLIYNVNYLHIPNYLLLTTLRAIPSLYVDLKEQQGQKALDEHFIITGGDENDSEFNGSVAGGGYKGFNPNFKKDNKPIAVFFVRNNSKTYPAESEMSLEWTSLVKDRFGVVAPGKLVPGKYKVKGSFRTTIAHDLNLYVNDELVAKFNASDGKYSWKSGDIGTYTYTGEVGPVRIKLEDARKKQGDRRISVQYIEFIPDEDNY